MKSSKNSVKTQSELAKRLGVTKQAVSDWLKRPDWPFSRGSPWDVEQVRVWRDSHLTGRQANPSVAEATAELKREQLAALKTKRQQIEGALVPRSYLNTFIGRWSAEIRTHLDESCDVIPAGWPYNSAVELRDKVRAVYTALCERLTTATEDIERELEDPTAGKDRRNSRAQHRRHRT